MTEHPSGAYVACSRAHCDAPAAYRFRFQCDRGHVNEPVRCVEHTAEDRAYSGGWCCSTATPEAWPHRCPASSRLVGVASASFDLGLSGGAE